MGSRCQWASGLGADLRLFNQGTRHIAPARVAGAGKYIIHSTEAKDTPKASKDMSKVYKTVLAYALEAPHKVSSPSPAQRSIADTCI